MLCHENGDGNGRLIIRNRSSERRAWLSCNLHVMQQMVSYHMQPCGILCVHISGFLNARFYLLNYSSSIDLLISTYSYIYLVTICKMTYRLNV